MNRALTVRWLPRFLLLGLMLFLTGCMKRAEQDGVIVHYIDPLVIITLFAVALIGVPIGALMVYSNPRDVRNYVALFGAVGWLVLSPSMFFQRVTITTEHFRKDSGLWWFPPVEIAYGDVDAIHLHEQRGRKGSITYLLDCELRNGESREVSFSEKVAVLDILREAERHQIPIAVIE